MYMSKHQHRWLNEQLAKWHKVLLVCLLLLLSLPANAWWNQEWAYRKQLSIDPVAAKIQSDVERVPVLIRLHEGVFPFTDASPDGADLRFVAEDDKTPLKYHIEKFDSVFNMAFVWVDIPKVAANGKTNIWMYYGNPKAVKGDDETGTYDNNQLLTYHFSERGTPVKDATANANNSTSIIELNDAGLIGNSAKFNGRNVVIIPAANSLNTQPTAPFTLSVWVKPTTANSTGIIYARRDAGNAIILGLNQGAPYVSITSKGATQQTAALPPLEANQWYHLTISAAQDTKFYINAALKGQINVPTVALNTLAVIGADAPAGLDAAQISATPQQGFTGEIDEFQIAKQTRSDAWVGVTSSNQSSEDKLIGYGVDEQATTWSTGYFGIIISSLTFDGWLVIGVLAIMAVLSWIVMVRKVRQVGKTSRANEVFQRVYRKVGGDLIVLHKTIKDETDDTISKNDRQLIQQSPLFHMFQTAIDELNQRIEAEKNHAPSNLSSQSIEAIKSTLEASLVNESQQLNKSLVLLTIAISGGPFLGLLGTVVGVMITFAAIATSGDVNINAIAPGVAGALMATVVGLLVAIPALFGYNYLITRIKDVTAQMHLFLDLLITRMAENYNKPSSLSPSKVED
ncbi:Protein TolQ [Acinetobacter oleivorans]|nr:Protein TolQ [Acinetobacter oleivorans]CAI3099601.1 Protein TolQ [Acinetobacter oleivorans]CAI3099610.1 Protein TolQ [Acinetobacter oleivorans]CAI3099647.1 Protein TolQ [Acinetobacter oleivorans]CAI3118894.1 Protein TolQ [Acinetobacter oleivorans]